MIRAIFSHACFSLLIPNLKGELPMKITDVQASVIGRHELISAYRRKAKRASIPRQQRGAASSR